MKGIDTIFMGRTTYEQIYTELSPGIWPYEKATTYVLTHKTSFKDCPRITSKNIPTSQLVNKLKQNEGKDIWICGGVEVINSLLRKNFIDKFHIAIILILLGNGTRLFRETTTPSNLKLVHTLQDNGIIETIYERSYCPRNPKQIAVFIKKHSMTTMQQQIMCYLYST